MSFNKAKSKNSKSESISKETENLKRNLPKGDVVTDPATEDDGVKKY